MPHFIAEYSSNLEEQIDFQAFFGLVSDYLSQSGVFPTAGIRCRAFRADHYYIADNQQDYRYIHLIFKIGFGRSYSTQKKAADELFTIIVKYFEPIQAEQYLAISFEVQEINPLLTYKKNNLHSLFKKE